MENGVGETVLEIAALLNLQSRIGGLPGSSSAQLNAYSVDSSPNRVDVSKLKEELLHLRSTITMLVTEGKLTEDAAVIQEFTRFLGVMDAKVAENETAHAQFAPVDTPQLDKDVSATFNLLKEAVASDVGERHLVHLIDVQRSINGDLADAADDEDGSHEQDDGDGLEAEEDQDEIDRAHLLINGHIWNIFDLFE